MQLKMKGRHIMASTDVFTSASKFRTFLLSPRLTDGYFGRCRYSKSSLARGKSILACTVQEKRTQKSHTSLVKNPAPPKNQQTKEKKKKKNTTHTLADKLRRLFFQFNTSSLTVPLRILVLLQITRQGRSPAPLTGLFCTIFVNFSADSLKTTLCKFKMIQITVHKY